MAQAHLKTKVVEVQVPKYEAVNDGVTLRLDDDETKFLADVLGRIGGHVRDSRRRYAETISVALRESGYDWDRERFADISKGMYVEDEVPA